MKYDDPCAAAAQLRAAYTALITGGGAQRVVVEGGGGKRDTTFIPGNIVMLQNEIRDAEAQCANLIDPTTPRRFAIRAGSRRSNWPLG
jgi:hypothetical protein